MSDTKDMWDTISKEVPALRVMFLTSQSVHDTKGKYFRANELWYWFFKPHLETLVGWNSKHKGDVVLGGAKAYTVAYQKIYDALPACRNCNCLGGA